MERASTGDNVANTNSNSNPAVSDNPLSAVGGPQQQQQQHHFVYDLTPTTPGSGGVIGEVTLPQHPVVTNGGSGNNSYSNSTEGPHFVHNIIGGMGGVGGPPPPGGSSSSSNSMAPPGPPPHMSAPPGIVVPGQGGGHQLIGSQHVMAPAPVAADENYCLRWNDYEKKYAETFRVLRDDEYFTDVTLATEGHSVKAHRVILSACSNYFHAILKTMSPWQHPVLLLQDVKSSDLNSLMDFIYFGQVSVTQDSLQSFLKVAQKLKIKGLCETIAPPPPPSVTIPLSAVTPTHVAGALPPHSRIMTPQGGGGSLHPPSQSAAASMSPHPANSTLSGSNNGSSNNSGTPIPGPGGHSTSANSNFEGLLPRSPYIPEPSTVPLSSGSQTLVSAPSPIMSAGGGGGRSSMVGPPLAHQSQTTTRQSRTSAPPRGSTETLIHYSSTPKRPKFTTTVPTSALSPQSILRNQLSQQHKDSGAGPSSGNGGEVEVKSEPMTILTPGGPNPHHTGGGGGGGAQGGAEASDVPSSGVNVNEFITTHDSDLTLPSLGHGISPQFMFSPDPPGSEGAHHANLPGPPQGPPGAMVTVDDKTAVRLEQSGGSIQVVTAGTSCGQQQQHQHVIPQQLQHIHSHLQHSGQGQHQQQQHQQQQQQQHEQHEQHQDSVDEPQDLTPGPLTPGPQDSPSPAQASANNGGGAMSLQSTPTTSANNSLVGSPSPTPPKGKDRNTRKTCGYCHKDFHEMSLKRHIKDVHFRNQNTYVICPQCCKQYASQNSLYSHLNRVHGVKKDMLQDMQIQVMPGNPNSGSSGGSSQGSGPGNNSGTPTPGGSHENHHDGIMDLAQHSDSSNG